MLAVSVTRVSVEAWHKAGLEGGDVSGLLPCKVGPTSDVKAVDGTGVKQRFTISTSAIDREGDRIDVKGWDLANFISGGSILLGHNRDIVVAKPSDTRVSRRALRSVAEFTPREVSEKGFEVGQLVAGGFIRSSSVGFSPGEWEVSDREVRGFKGINFTKGHELFEWSVLPVPANPEALSEAMGKGLGVSVIRSWAEQELDCGRTLVMPKFEAEQLYRDADAKASVSVPVPGDLEAGAADDGGEGTALPAVEMSLAERRDASLASARAAETEMVSLVEMALTALSVSGGVTFAENEKRLRAAFDRHGWSQAAEIDFDEEVARALPGIIQGAVASAMAQ